MRKVAYCAAGTVVSFPIPDAVFDSRAELSAIDDDLRIPCAVLERVVAGVYRGEPGEVGAELIRAACQIWRFCNYGREDGEDVVVVDYVGDGKSVEFAPLAELACSATLSCACQQSISEVTVPPFLTLPDHHSAA